MTRDQIEREYIELYPNVEIGWMVDNHLMIWGPKTIKQLKEEVDVTELQKGDLQG